MIRGLDSQGIPAESPLRVIHVLGFARSGSTILGNLLNECDGYLHIGELRQVWKRVSRGGGQCGCGKKLLACDLWSEALAVTVSRLGYGTERSLSDFATRMWEIQLGESGAKHRGLPGDRSSQLKSLAMAMEELLKSLAELSGARVIVDTSKRPDLAAYAEHLDTVEVHFLHLVRDARGAVFSRQRRLAPRKGDRLLLKPHTLLADSVRWIRTNLAASSHSGSGRATRIMRLRYEDLIQQPVPALIEIGDWVGVPISREKLPRIEAGVVHLGLNHTVHGNLNRFEIGEVSLALDERWKAGLRTRDYLAITVMTGLMLSRYGYAIRRES